MANNLMAAIKASPVCFALLVLAMIGCQDARLPPTPTSTPTVLTKASVDAILTNPGSEIDSHVDYPPGLDEIASHGLSAIPFLLDAAKSHNELVRLRAIKGLEVTTCIMHGFAPGMGWKTNKHHATWSRLWVENGDLDSKMSERELSASLARWRQWLDERKSQ